MNTSPTPKAEAVEALTHQLMAMAQMASYSDCMLIADLVVTRELKFRELLAEAVREDMLSEPLNLKIRELLK